MEIGTPGHRTNGNFSSMTCAGISLVAAGRWFWNSIPKKTANSTQKMYVNFFFRMVRVFFARKFLSGQAKGRRGRRSRPAPAPSLRSLQERPRHEERNDLCVGQGFNVV